jgi:hypothetical protein
MRVLNIDNYHLHPKALERPSAHVYGVFSRSLARSYLEGCVAVRLRGLRLRSCIDESVRFVGGDQSEKTNKAKYKHDLSQHAERVGHVTVAMIAKE